MLAVCWPVLLRDVQSRNDQYSPEYRHGRDFGLSHVVVPNKLQERFTLINQYPRLLSALIGMATWEANVDGLDGSNEIDGTE